MACAGIIGASHTTDSAEGASPSSGVISMNPCVKFLPVQVYDTSGIIIIDKQEEPRQLLMRTRMGQISSPTAGATHIAAIMTFRF